MSKPMPLDPLAFPLNGARLIEASAGTGKTWTIAALYVRLVLGHGADGTGFERSLTPPEILVVTFTEAATLELRDRIRKRLNEAAMCFRGLAQGDRFLQALRESYPPDQRLACARRLDLASQWMDEAAIFTIHGWCNRMLRQHAFESGSLFNLEIDATDTELLREVVRDYWRIFFYALDELSAQAVLKLAANPEQLLARMHRLLSETEAGWRNRDAVLEEACDPGELLRTWVDWENQRQALEEFARRTWAEDVIQIEQWLFKAQAEGWLNGSTYPADKFAGRVEALADWAKFGKPCERKWLEGFAQSRIKLKKQHQDKLIQHQAFAALDAWIGHGECEPEVEKEILVHTIEWVRKRYAEEKKLRARLDFDDLLAELDRALRGPGGPRLAEVIRRQYPVALIDEFQDTDPIQLRIFDRVYPLDSTAANLGCFIIGDPKQAIYSFRGADIFTYLQARVATAGRHYTLERNFRSTVAMVDAVNRFFGHAEQMPGGAFRFKTEAGENPLPFWPATAQGRTEALLLDGQPVPAMTLWHLPGDEQGAACPMAEYRQIMANAAASEIVRLLTLAGHGRVGFHDGEDFTPLKSADLAILVRDRFEAAAMRQALAGREVRSVYLSDRDSVFATTEAADMLFWLRACAEPGRDHLVRAALATATLGLEYAELERLNREEARWEEEVERFAAYRKIWRQQGVMPMLRRLLMDFSVPARLLTTLEGERRLTNLLHLAEWLQAASAELEGEQALLRHMADACESSDNPTDETLLRLESDEDLVKVVTLHKAKGLEYPLVFLPFICSFKEATGGRKTYYRYHDGQGRLLIDLGKGEEAGLRAEQERLQEDLRLLYVALTRSRHACWLGVAPVKSGNTKACQLEKTAMGQVLNGGLAMGVDDLGVCLAQLQASCANIRITPPPEADSSVYCPPGEALTLQAARVFGGRKAGRWWIASYSALQVEEDGTEAPSDAMRSSEPPDTPRQANLEENADEAAGPVQGHPPGRPDIHQFPRGAKPGTFLHGLLEWAARAGFGKIAREQALRKDAIARRCHTRGWMAWINPLDEWLGRLLTLPLSLPDDHFTLADLAPRSCQPELEFWLPSAKLRTSDLDRLVTRHTLQGADRPKLMADELNGMLKGFIDLVFEHGGRYYIADYKSNWLGPDDAAYTKESMASAVLAKRYDLQYALYLLALHRHLQDRMGEEYDYDRHIGGALYLFLRGVEGTACGLHVEKPPRVLIESLDELFDGGEVGL